MLIKKNKFYLIVKYHNKIYNFSLIKINKNKINNVFKIKIYKMMIQFYLIKI